MTLLMAVTEPWQLYPGAELQGSAPEAAGTAHQQATRAQAAAQCASMHVNAHAPGHDQDTGCLAAACISMRTPTPVFSLCACRRAGLPAACSGALLHESPVGRQRQDAKAGAHESLQRGQLQGEAGPKDALQALTGGPQTADRRSSSRGHQRPGRDAQPGREQKPWQDRQQPARQPWQPSADAATVFCT